jgi:hypothetical protein
MTTFLHDAGCATCLLGYFPDGHPYETAAERFKRLGRDEQKRRMAPPGRKG